MNLTLSVYSSALCSSACQIVLLTIKFLSCFDCSMRVESGWRWFLSRWGGGSSQVLGTLWLQVHFQTPLLKHLFVAVTT